MQPVTIVERFERFFRVAASLDGDKSDLRRFSEFVNQKTYRIIDPEGKNPTTPHWERAFSIFDLLL